MKSVPPNSLGAAEKFLHEKIPLTRAMGLRVVGNDSGGFTIEAPIALNSNHLGTAFGGSINAVATLAGYGLLWLEIQETPADIIIRESSIRFLHPIRTVIRARCARPETKDLLGFHESLRISGKARISLSVGVEENGRTGAELRGTFVALRRHPTKEKNRSERFF
ncbi:MAG: YiiD C-terminal domain-containing protein [Chthoniobacterales bacterium]